MILAAPLAVLVGALGAAGGRPALAIAGALVLVIFAGALTTVLAPCFAIWLAVTGVAYPFLRYPFHSVHTLITFDRAVVPALAIGALFMQTRTPSRDSSRVARALMVLVALVGLRAVTSPGVDERAASLDRRGARLPSLVFLVARQVGGTAAGQRRIVTALVFAGTTIAVVGLAEHFGGFNLASYSGGVPRYDQAIGLVRIAGPYAEPEVYALALLCCFGATLYWTIAKLSRFWMAGWIAAGLEVAALGLTFFRTAWIAAAIVFVGALAVRRGQVGRRLMVGGILVACLYGLFVELQQNSSTFAVRVGNTSNVYARLATYEEGWQIFSSHPLVGVGLDRYTPTALARSTVTVHGFPAVPAPHDSFLEILTEQGLVGFLAVVIVIWSLTRLLRAFRRKAISRLDGLLWVTGLFVAIAYTLMSVSLAMFVYGPSNSFFMVIIGIVAGRLDTLDEEDDSPVPAQQWAAGRLREHRTHSVPKVLSRR